VDRPATSLERIRLLEALAAHAWPAATIETLAGWRLSMDRGVTRRANSVIANALGHDADPPRLIDQVERRYRARSLSPCFKLCRATEPPDLRRRLQERGYREEGFSHVLTGAPGACATPPAEDVAICRSLEPDAAWLGACWPSVAAHALAAQHAIVARIGLPRTFVLATVDGKPAGAGLGVCERGHACLSAIHTLPDHRRRGVARSIVAAIARWAEEHGAHLLYLQVEADNLAARQLYATQGFRRHHDYHYACLP